MGQLKYPLIEWCAIKSKTCLRFTFKGTLTKEDAERASEEWKNIFSRENINDVIIVWHCIEMKGYEPMARSIWQNTLKELKNQIKCIWLVTDSSIIKTGALIISTFTSYNIRIAKSEDNIEI